jgi:hypothetical protein
MRTVLQGQTSMQPRIPLRPLLKNQRRMRQGPLRAPRSTPTCVQTLLHVQASLQPQIPMRQVHPSTWGRSKGSLHSSNWLGMDQKTQERPSIPHGQPTLLQEAKVGSGQGDPTPLHQMQKTEETMQSQVAMREMCASTRSKGRRNLQTTETKTQPSRESQQEEHTKHTNTATDDRTAPQNRGRERLRLRRVSQRQHTMRQGVTVPKMHTEARDGCKYPVQTNSPNGDTQGHCHLELGPLGLAESQQEGDHEAPEVHVREGRTTRPSGKTTSLLQ